MTVKQAASVMECSPQFVREMCKREILGTVYGRSKEVKHYQVSPAKVMEWMGISAEELERRLK